MQNTQGCFGIPNKQAVPSVTASYFASANNTVSSTQSANFDSKIYDDLNTVTASPAGTGSWRFTAPFPGKYQAVVYYSVTTAASFYIAIYKNGVLYRYISPSTGATSNGMLAVGTVPLNKNEYFDIRTNVSTSCTGSTLGGSTASCIDIQRVGD